MKDYFQKALYEYVKRISRDDSYNENEIRWMNYLALYSLS